MLDILAAQIAVLRAQVGGLQAQIDVLAAVVEEALGSQRPIEPEPCQHLETDDEGSTLGISRRRCRACRQLIVEELTTA